MAGFLLVEGVLNSFATHDPNATGHLLAVTRFLGRCELATAVAILVPWNRPLLVVLVLLLVAQLMAMMFIAIFASQPDGLLWFHPFGPLTKNVPVVVALSVVFYVANEMETRGARRLG
jgi:hypothetical protein